MSRNSRVPRIIDHARCKHLLRISPSKPVDTEQALALGSEPRSASRCSGMVYG
jgi:hypothetical protein